MEGLTLLCEHLLQFDERVHPSEHRRLPIIQLAQLQNLDRTRVVERVCLLRRALEVRSCGPREARAQLGAFLCDVLLRACAALGEVQLMLLTVQSTPDQMVFEWQFDTNTFSTACAEQFTQHYLVLLKALLTGADTLVEELTLLSDAEINQLRV